MIYLIGASGHAKVILEILEQQGVAIGCLIDSNPNIVGLLDYSVATELPEVFDMVNDSIIISIGNNFTRKKLAMDNRCSFAKAIHPSSNLSPRCEVREGTVVMAGVSVNTGVKIGAHVILNTNSSVDHDCVIENFVHVSPNAALAGNIFVGEGSHIGAGATIIQGVRIGKWVTIGAGAVIINNVPDYAVVVGSPGRIIKYNGKI